MNFETLMQIDLKKLKNNTKSLVKSYNDYQYKMANLKNNAYGMNYNIVNTLVNNGINYIQVGSLKEAIMVRKYNSDIPIVASYFMNLEEVYDAISNNIDITIYSLDHLKKIKELKIKDKINIHLLIDNDSNKLGIKNNNELQEMITLITEHKYLNLKGIYSSITTLGVEDEFYYKQVDNFYNLISNFINKDLMIYLNEPIMYHSKLKFINGIAFDLSLLGIEENINDSFFSNKRIKNIEKKYKDLEFPNINLELVFNITSEVMSIKKVNKGSLVGRNYIAKKDMLVGVIPIGHKDGITKAINYVGINNIKRQVIADEIDYLIVEVDENVKIKDKVYIVNEERGIYDFLTLLRTNRYYLMSVLNKDIRKEYINIDAESDENYL